MTGILLVLAAVALCIVIVYGALGVEKLRAARDDERFRRHTDQALDVVDDPKTDRTWTSLDERQLHRFLDGQR
jgi:hypothetical protein